MAEEESRTERRRFLQTTGAALLTSLAPGTSAGVVRADPTPAHALSEDVPERANEHLRNYVLHSQPLPQPAIVLPTDALSDPAGPKKRIAAITTAYFRYSHADDIITRFIEGYSVIGRIHVPHCQVVSLHVEQFPDTDISRGMAARYRIPTFDSPADALTLGGRELAVDGVLLVAEHGDYPINEKGQKLYPRRRMFEEIVNVFRGSGRSVPVYNDKHLAYAWSDARWMYQRAKELGFPMMAGSSVPVTWRVPPLVLRDGVELEGALAISRASESAASIDHSAYHTLEALQAFVEHRKGGETGVQSVHVLEGDSAWESAEAGHWSPALLKAAIELSPSGTASADLAGDRRQLRQADPNPAVLLVEYTDGLRAAVYLARRLNLGQYGFAAKVRGVDRPVATWCYLPIPQRDHFSFLCNHLEVMFRSGSPSYPVERTYLVTGILAAAADSRSAGHTRIETRHLRNLAYTPVAEAAFD